MFSYWNVIPPSLQASLRFYSLWKTYISFQFCLCPGLNLLHLQLISYFKEKQKSLWFTRLAKFNIFPRNSGSVFPNNKFKCLNDIISSLLTLIKISIFYPIWSPSYSRGKLSINFIHFKQYLCLPHSVLKLQGLIRDTNNMHSWTPTLSMYDEITSSKTLKCSNVKNIWLLCVWFKVGSLGQRDYTFINEFSALWRFPCNLLIRLQKQEIIPPLDWN